MPPYLVSSRGPSGRRVTQLLQAPSGDAVVKKLEQHGHDDIVLHTDDMMAAVFTPGKAAKRFSPRELLILMRGSTLARAWMLQVHVVRGISYILLLLMWLLTIAARLPRGFSWNWFDTCVVLALFVLPWLLPLVLIPLSAAGRFRRVCKALAWGRWEQAQAGLRGLKRRLKPYQVAQVETRVLAGLGRVDEATDQWRAFGDGEALPLWLWWCHLADLYTLGRNARGAIEAHEEALSLNPECPALMLGCALARLRFRQDIARAQALVREAATHAMSETLRFAYSMVQGLLALAAKDAQKAREHLEQSLREMALLHQSPLAAKVAAEIRAYLAIACAGVGDGPQARHHFQRAEPILKAHHAADLLSSCEQALGGVA